MSLPEETAPEEIRDILQPLTGGTFRFDCHPGVPCFTECCRALKLALTPYDVLRLKNRLEISSGDFLENYAETCPDEHRQVPAVFLMMQNNERQTCPFVSQSGCRVYEDRPAACRMYPAARASRVHRLHGSVQEDFFLLREEHCKGFNEEKNWQVEEWTMNQGLEPYHEFNNAWMKIVTHPRLRQGQSLSEKQQQMFMMAGYNLDRFRDFVLNSRFLQLFEVEPERAGRLGDNDEALLGLAMDWLDVAILGGKALKPRDANP